MKRTVIALAFILLLPVCGAYASTIYHGNTKSMIYHQPWCKYYNCKTCTKSFYSWKNAEHAGFTHCKVCVLPYPPLPTPKATPSPRPPPRPPTPPPDSFQEAFSNLLKNIVGLMVAQLIVFGFFNCFLEKDMEIMERWKRFQGWLFGKNTAIQLKNKTVQTALETEKLTQVSWMKKRILHFWYILRSLLFRFNKFIGCFVNFILLSFFLLASWNNGKYVILYGWDWITTMMG